MQRILISTDGSASAREAVEFGLDLAHEEGAEVVFVHATLPIELAMYPFGPIDAIPDSAPTVEQDEFLQEALAAALAKGVSARAVSVLGDPVVQVPAYAADMNADLIVIGSRGHGGLTGALLGSVSRGVLKHANCPVLVVRAAHAAVAA